MAFVGELAEKYNTVSIVGMAKNSGKTTALNYLLEEAYDEGLLCAVTSTGRDGETTDLVTTTEKPKVYLFSDSIVSVPEQLYELAETGLEILRRTQYRTALGNVLICRVAESGYVQIAGPGSIREHKRLCDDMRSYGCDIVFIDGAIDRKSIAAPESSDAIILATGAVISRSLKVVVEETVHIVNLYRTPVLEDEEARSIFEKEDKGVYRILAMDDEYRVKDPGVRTALGAGSTLDSIIDEHTRYLYIPGAFTESIVGGINPKKLRNITLVLPDPTRIFIGATRWQQLLKRGMKLRVMENIEVAAVTVNPYAPAGYHFDHEQLRSAVADALGDVPVFDVRAGGLE
ncbi:MAG: hypothetical protein GX975_03460 [Clostridiales bacterium]|nr:hypothetical protein [Clostridiales bacterium]